jgi:hypothetical protein
VAFLQFSRDRRGYENTFLLHASRPHGDEERPRLLYWFRTPPHLKVGRGPFDDDAIRSLEIQYPNVEFDWTRLLESTSANANAAERGSDSGEAPEGQPAGFDKRKPRGAGRRQKSR